MFITKTFFFNIWFTIFLLMLVCYSIKCLMALKQNALIREARYKVGKQADAKLIQRETWADYTTRFKCKLEKAERRNETLRWHSTNLIRHSIWVPPRLVWQLIYISVNLNSTLYVFTKILKQIIIFRKYKHLSQES